MEEKEGIPPPQQRYVLYWVYYCGHKIYNSIQFGIIESSSVHVNSNSCNFTLILICTGKGLFPFYFCSHRLIFSGKQM